jgi:hypothetical protein
MSENIRIQILGHYILHEMSLLTELCIQGYSRTNCYQWILTNFIKKKVKFLWFIKMWFSYLLFILNISLLLNKTKLIFKHKDNVIMFIIRK